MTDGNIEMQSMTGKRLRLCRFVGNLVDKN